MSGGFIISEMNSELSRKNKIIRDSYKVGKYMQDQCVTRYMPVIMMGLSVTFVKVTGQEMGM
jgi:hypothetical protein